MTTSTTPDEIAGLREVARQLEQNVRLALARAEKAERERDELRELLRRVQSIVRGLAGFLGDTSA